MNLIFFRRDVSGGTKGELNFFQAGVVGLGAELQRLAAQSFDESNIEIQYDATVLPEKSPTTLPQLLKLVEDFPASLKGGKGAPMEVAICFCFFVFLAFFAFFCFKCKLALKGLQLKIDFCLFVCFFLRAFC